MARAPPERRVRPARRRRARAAHAPAPASRRSLARSDTPYGDDDGDEHCAEDEIAEIYASHVQDEERNSSDALRGSSRRRPRAARVVTQLDGPVALHDRSSDAAQHDVESVIPEEGPSPRLRSRV